jgi:5-methylcytosine-specific restriction endonuclease McrA
MIRIENFNNKNGVIGSSSYCKKCTTEQSLSRMRKLKQQMVDYKGGCCQKCGYDKYIGALEFHHINPEEKDFNPSHLKKYTFDDRVKNELDKCVLLCSNCHRETHHEINEKKKELC